MIRGINIKDIKKIVAVLIITMVAGAALSMQAYADVEYWVIKAGSTEIAMVNSEASARQVIDKLEATYTGGDENATVTVNPGLSIEQQFYKRYEKKPELVSVDEALSKALARDDHGDKILDVTVTKEVESTKKIKYNVVYKETDKLARGESEVRTKGKKGKRTVKTLVTSVNGEVTSEEVISNDVTKEPVDEVILTGTRQSASKKGQTVVEYALQFVGNPYKYGGTSLTHGADCSGFIYRIYQDFGVSDFPRVGAESFGTGVSFSEAKPGDIICYRDHYGLYIGDNKIVHAMNESHGITVSTIGYNGKPIVAVRRVYN